MEIHSIFESPSRLNNFKRENGIKISTPHHASDYILCAKIKKEITAMSDEHWEVLKSSLAPRAVKEGKETLVYRQQNNAEILNSATLRYLWDVKEREGSIRFFQLLSVAEPKLRRMAEGKAEVKKTVKLVKHYTDPGIAEDEVRVLVNTKGKAWYPKRKAA